MQSFYINIRQLKYNGERAMVQLLEIGSLSTNSNVYFSREKFRLFKISQ